MAPVSNPTRTVRPLCLYDIRAMSDVVIKCGDDGIFAHKAFLGAKSEYFFRAFTGQFPVASSGVIDLGDDERPEIIRMMIRHIYGLPFQKPGVSYSPEGLLYLIDLFTASDKYDVPTLRDEVLDKFTRRMSSRCHTEEWIMCIQKLNDPGFVGLADKRLKDAVITFCTFDIRRLLKNSWFSGLLKNGDTFAGDLVHTIIFNRYAKLGDL